MDLLLQEELKLNAITCAVIIVGLRRGYSPKQQIDFWVPWGKAPESKEEQAFQDLKYIHRVLPPTEVFNSDLADKGYYTKLRWQKQDEFWSTYDPEQDKQITYRNTYKPRPYPIANKTFKPFKPSNPNTRKLRKLKNV